MLALAAAPVLQQSPETAAVQRRQTAPVAQPASMALQSIKAAPRSLPIVAVSPPPTTSMAGGKAEASGVDRTAQLVAVDLVSQPGSARAALLAAAPTAALLAAAPTAVDATAAGITAATDATAAGITAAADATAAGVTAAGATAAGMPITTSPAPSPMTIRGSATPATSETVAGPPTKPAEAAALPDIVGGALLAPSVVAGGGGRIKVDEGDSLVGHHGGGGPSHLDDLSVPCKPVSEHHPTSVCERSPPDSEHPPPPVVASVEESSRVPPTVEKVAALATLTRAVHEPVGVGLCIAELGLVPHARNVHPIHNSITHL